MLQVSQKKSHSYKWLLIFEVAQRNQFPTNFIRCGVLKQYIDDSNCPEIRNSLFMFELFRLSHLTKFPMSAKDERNRLARAEFGI